MHTQLVISPPERPRGGIRTSMMIAKMSLNSSTSYMGVCITPNVVCVSRTMELSFDEVIPEYGCFPTIAIAIKRENRISGFADTRPSPGSPYYHPCSPSRPCCGRGGGRDKGKPARRGGPSPPWGFVRSQLAVWAGSVTTGTRQIPLLGLPDAVRWIRGIWARS